MEDSLVVRGEGLAAVLRQGDILVQNGQGWPHLLLGKRHSLLVSVILGDCAAVVRMALCGSASHNPRSQIAAPMTIWASEPASDGRTLLAAGLGRRVRVDQLNTFLEAGVADTGPNVVNQVVLLDFVAHFCGVGWIDMDKRSK